MDGNQLDQILRKSWITSQDFLGVFPADGLPSPASLPASFSLAVNNMGKSHAGQHWLGIHCVSAGKKRIVEYFDTNGLPILSPTIHNFVSHLTHDYFYSQRVIQSPTSNICGLYVALFIYYRASGVSYKDFVNMFPRFNFWFNDCKAISESSDIFGEDIISQPSKSTSRFCNRMLTYK